MGSVVGIGGVSRAGKSTLSKLLSTKLSGRRIMILDMDDFVWPESRIPRIRNETDWETTDSVDYSKLIVQVNIAKADCDLVIVVGILIFYHKRLEAIFDKKIFIEIPYNIFLERKRIDRRWNEPEWYIQHIWDSYLKYGKKNVVGAIKIDGTRPFDDSEILAYLISEL